MFQFGKVLWGSISISLSLQHQNQLTIYYSTMKKENQKLVGVSTIVGRDKSEMMRMSVDQFLTQIVIPTFQTEVEEIRQAQHTGQRREMQRKINELPIFYPNGLTTGKSNGLAAFSLQLTNPHDIEEIMEHVRGWRWWKGDFVNCRGAIVGLVYLGDVPPEKWRNRCKKVARLMTECLGHKAMFQPHGSMLSGLLFSYDPYAFCRTDDDLCEFPNINF